MPEQQGSSLYRAWALGAYVPFLVLSTAFWGSMAILLSPIDSNLAFRCGSIWSRGLCRLNFTRVQVSGREHLVPGQAYVIMANHQSLFDIPVLAGWLKRPFRWVMKQELRKVPFMGWACAATGNIFVDRRDRQRAIASLEAARPLLEAGTSIIVFPEGTRADGEALGPFKKGGFMVAIDAGLPIVPVTISGTAALLPNRTWRLAPGKVQMQIHPPIATADYGLEGRDRLMAEVRRAIASGLSVTTSAAEETAAPGALEHRPATPEEGLVGPPAQEENRVTVEENVNS